MPKFEVEVVFRARPQTMMVEAESLADAWKRRQALVSGLEPMTMSAQVVSVAALDNACGECEGTGEVEDVDDMSNKVPCWVCGGTGQVLTPRANDAPDTTLARGPQTDRETT